MKNSRNVIIGIIAVILCFAVVLIISNIKVKKAQEAMAAQQQVEISQPSVQHDVDPDDPVEQKVSSPEEGFAPAHELPSQDHPDYHLELLRQPKWEWKDLGDGKIEYRGKTYKRKSNVKAILGMGIDKHFDLEEEREKVDRGVCDGIFLIAHDKSANTSKVLMIPRNTISEINQYNESGEYEGNLLNHISLAYSQFPEGKAGSENMVTAVSEFLCGLEINDYATINLDVLGKVTDAVDGVTVIIPNDQLQIAYPEWTEGKNVTLHGDDAEKFIRYRNSAQEEEDQTALFRMSQHKEFIVRFFDAIKQKSKTDSNIINELYDILENNMVTSMNKGEILRLGADGLQGDLSADDILMVPGEKEYREYLEYYADYEKLIPIILDSFYREVS